MANVYDAGARYQAAVAEFIDAYTTLYVLNGGGFPAGRLPDLREIAHSQFAPNLPAPDGLSNLIAAKKIELSRG
jgi:hypothetical protein